MITLFCLFLHFVECLHDKAVIDDSGSNHAANRKWHIYDALLWLFIYSVLAITGGWFWLLAGGAARLFMLQVGLNKIRGLSIFHLGKGGIDGFCAKWIGKELTIVIKSVLVATTLIIELCANFG